MTEILIWPIPIESFISRLICRCLVFIDVQRLSKITKPCHKMLFAIVSLVSFRRSLVPADRAVLCCDCLTDMLLSTSTLQISSRHPLNVLQGVGVADLAKRNHGCTRRYFIRILY